MHDDERQMLFIIISSRFLDDSLSFSLEGCDNVTGGVYRLRCQILTGKLWIWTEPVRAEVEYKEAVTSTQRWGCYRTSFVLNWPSTSTSARSRRWAELAFHVNLCTLKEVSWHSTSTCSGGEVAPHVNHCALEKVSWPSTSTSERFWPEPFQLKDVQETIVSVLLKRNNLSQPEQFKNLGSNRPCECPRWASSRNASQSSSTIWSSRWRPTSSPPETSSAARAKWPGKCSSSLMAS